MGWVNTRWGALSGRFAPLRPLFRDLEDSLNPEWFYGKGSNTPVSLPYGTFTQVPVTTSLRATGGPQIVSGSVRVTAPGLYRCVAEVAVSGTWGTAGVAQVQVSTIPTDGSLHPDGDRIVFGQPSAYNGTWPVVWDTLVTVPSRVKIAVGNAGLGATLSAVLNRVTIAPVDLEPMNAARFSR